MSFHTFLSSEPKLVSDEKMKMLIKETFASMRGLLLQEDYLLSSKERFRVFTEKFFKRLGYLFDKKRYDDMPDYVLRAKYVEGGRNHEKLNSEKYNTELSLKVFKEFSEYYLLRGTTWKRINKRLNRNPELLTSRQKILADAFLNTSNGMDGNKIYTQIIENKEFEHYLMEDDDDNGGCLDGCLDGCTTMLYDDANKF